MAALLTRTFSPPPPTADRTKPPPLPRPQPHRDVEELEQENKRLKEQLLTMQRRAGQRRSRLSQILHREAAKDEAAGHMLARQRALQGEISQLEARHAAALQWQQDSSGTQGGAQAGATRPSTAQSRRGAAVQGGGVAEAAASAQPCEQGARATARSVRPTARPASAVNSRAQTPLWKRQQELGTTKLLKLGVPRAKTPAHKTYISNSARKLIRDSGVPIDQVPPPRDYPGAQRILEQRGAGQNGMLRALGNTMVTFCPIPTCEDHCQSMMKHLHSPGAIGADPAMC